MPDSTIIAAIISGVAIIVAAVLGNIWRVRRKSEPSKPSSVASPQENNDEEYFISESIIVKPDDPHTYDLGRCSRGDSFRIVLSSSVPINVYVVDDKNSELVDGGFEFDAVYERNRVKNLKGGFDIPHKGRYELWLDLDDDEEEDDEVEIEVRAPE